ncbi:uncharacterized protein Z520_09819 [Fonsecaea multimorphosa CBS 102226]|uniref:Uncharacterized protein n=1 Tax=Fonsecaea multimorphosa CBS 102226 TaxID=1442371 RepID=A0A0D2KCM6_9EURO|nr:uncharacterized protein Z520_09819 [Fonsecaea multimorphosa CBS 102226]KIX94433.1 hypothetical protein Z520_09819 [Fonsecaea multimorphosa CBS 102226]OAL20014.1 hypothetical protein AYO22_09164 [Fonsecaea multimorphosa]
MSTARLRKTFKYPSEDDEDMSHEEMDEEEQEHLLQNLQASETSTNAIYTMVFTGLPLVVTLPFMWYLSRSTSRAMAFLCLLSITSLASSAYIMYMIPTSTPIGSLSSGPTRTTSSTTRQRQAHGTGVSQGAFLLTSSESPINQYLPYLNAFIDALLFIASMGYRSRHDVPEGLWLFLLLPGLIFAMVFITRRSMSEVHAGLAELEGLRYEYRGA